MTNRELPARDRYATEHERVRTNLALDWLYKLIDGIEDGTISVERWPQVTFLGVNFDSHRTVTFEVKNRQATAKKVCLCGRKFSISACTAHHDLALGSKSPYETAYYEIEDVEDKAPDR